MIKRGNLDDLFGPPAGDKPKNHVTNFNWTDPYDWPDSCQVVEIVKQATDDAHYTPDLPSLMIQKNHLVFVYGTLKEGYRNNACLHNSKFVGYASTNNRFNMLRTTNSKAPFPVVFADGRPERAGAIFGEVYSCPPSTVRDLDYLESNGTVYKRRLTPIVIANNNRTFKHTHAWMYIGLRSYWDSRKGWLEQIPAFKPKLNDKVRYYTFLPEHEQSK